MRFLLRTTPRFAVPIIALVMCLPRSAGADSLRCGDALVGEGATQAEVAARCGRPSQINHQTLYSEGAAAQPGGAPPGLPAPPGLLTRSGDETAAETWIYNFGPDRLMQSVRFENGVVVRIESLGYGY
jgi:Protein of unknown function (DUF2845)